MSDAAKEKLQQLRARLDPEQDKLAKVVAARKVLFEVGGLAVSVGFSWAFIHNSSAPIYAVQSSGKSVYLKLDGDALVILSKPQLDAPGTRLGPDKLGFNAATSTYERGVDTVVDEIVKVMNA